MFQLVISFLGSAYIEIIIFFVLIAYFLTHRRDPHMVASGINLLRVLLLLVIFLYFTWSWATLIPPSLRATSVFGMFVINCLHGLQPSAVPAGAAISKCPGGHRPGS